MSEAQQKKPADAWGQPIGEERQAELQGYIDNWAAETNHGDHRGPFDHRVDRWRLQLTGADVSWLASQSEGDWLNNLPVLHLEGANLYQAHLERANLRQAHLEGAFLVEATLTGANLESANLGGTDLRGARMGGVYLHNARLDSTTLLRNVIFDDGSRLGDIQWSGVGEVNLTQIDWNLVPRLGEERQVGIRSYVSAHETVVRAYRQLATQLRAQGMNEIADRFAERAQVRHRKLLLSQIREDLSRPWRLPGDSLRWLFSWFLALLAGYGYAPGRTLFWYLATIAGFAFAYLKATSGWIPFGLPHPSTFAPLTWYEALILSVSSFHGRGFFQPVQSLGDPIAALAAVEAVIGLLIEISFIATFTQRFFNSR